MIYEKITEDRFVHLMLEGDAFSIRGAKCLFDYLDRRPYDTKFNTEEIQDIQEEFTEYQSTDEIACDLCVYREEGMDDEEFTQVVIDELTGRGTLLLFGDDKYIYGE